MGVFGWSICCHRNKKMCTCTHKCLETIIASSLVFSTFVEIWNPFLSRVKRIMSSCVIKSVSVIQTINKSMTQCTSPSPHLHLHPHPTHTLIHSGPLAAAPGGSTGPLSLADSCEQNPLLEQALLCARPHLQPPPHSAPRWVLIWEELGLFM